MSTAPDFEKLAQYLSGECSESEKSEIEGWIQESPANQKLYENLKASWDFRNRENMNWDVESLWNRITAELDVADDNPSESDRPDLFRFMRTGLLRYAAAVLIIVSSFYLFNYLDSRPGTEYTVSDFLTMSVERGASEKLTLPDGSVVDIDAGSSISWPETFYGDTREVRLEGEAYFRINHNPDKPFIVRSGPASVTVLGTQFNVRSWPAEQGIVVAVAEGSVSLQSEGKRSSVILKKGEAGIVTRDGSVTRITGVDISLHIGWMERKKTFNDSELRDILYQVSRWYNVDITVEDESAYRTRLTMHLEGQPVGAVLELVSLLTNLNYEQTGNSVRFYRD